MRLLVTGGAGFIGSNFCRRWSQRHPTDRLVVLDALTYAGVRESLDDVAHTFVEGDIGDAHLVGRLLADHRIDVVVNFAAESHNSHAVVDPGRFFDTNVIGTQRLLEACRGYGRLERFHHMSTCEVFGDLALDAPPEAAFTGTSPYAPRTPYSASKAGADHAVRAYGHTFGLPVTISIGANTYGPYQFPEKLIPRMATRGLQARPLPAFASRQHRREWVHVDDLCRALEAIVLRGAAGDTYLVGTGEERSIEQVAAALRELLDLPASMVTEVPDRPGHDRRYLLDSRRVREELGWAPAIAFDDGLASTVAWYREHERWWRPLLDRVPPPARPVPSLR